jgi:hypothetical protein
MLGVRIQCKTMCFRAKWTLLIERMGSQRIAFWGWQVYARICGGSLHAGVNMAEKAGHYPDPRHGGGSRLEAAEKCMEHMQIYRPGIWSEHYFTITTEQQQSDVLLENLGRFKRASAVCYFESAQYTLANRSEFSTKFGFPTFNKKINSNIKRRAAQNYSTRIQYVHGHTDLLYTRSWNCAISTTLLQKEAAVMTHNPSKDRR